MYIDYTNNTVTQLANIDKMIQVTSASSYITYKQYLDFINPEITKIKSKDPDAIIGLGFWCCRTYNDIYSRRDVTVAPKDYDDYLEYKTIDLKSKIINSISKNQNMNITPAMFFTPLSSLPTIQYRFNSWTGTLSKLKDQGCKMNILSFWNFIPKPIAREKTLCITKETSIFRMIQHLNAFLNKTKTNTKRYEKWLILRFPIEHLNDYLSKANIKQSILHGNIIIITLKSKSSSSIDHTISFTSTQDIHGSIEFRMVDSHNMYFILFDLDINSEYMKWLDAIKQTYDSFDTIWIEEDQPNNSSFVFPDSKTEFMGIPYEIIPYNNENYGGNRFILHKYSRKKQKKRNTTRKTKGKNKKNNIRIRIIEENQVTPPNVLHNQLEALNKSLLRK